MPAPGTGELGATFGYDGDLPRGRRADHQRRGRKVNAPSQQTKPYPHPDVFMCDGCRSWTEEMVTEEELIRDWGWVRDNEDGHATYFCPECK